MVNDRRPSVRVTWQDVCKVVAGKQVCFKPSFIHSLSPFSTSTIRPCVAASDLGIMDKLVVKVKQSKILSFLPKVVSSSAVLTFQVSPPISPVGKGSSSSAPTIVSLIPKGAPRKSRNGSFDVREPASPKVSCIGQIKRNKKKKQAASKSKLPSPPPQATCAEQVKGKQASKVTTHGHKIAEAARVPSLGQTKQFSSARGTLSDFDWKTCDQAAGFVTNPLYEKKVVVNVNGVKESRNAKLWSRRTSTRLAPLQL